MSIYSNHAAFGLRNVDGTDTNCRSRILGLFSFLLCQRRLSGLLGFIFRRFGLCREVFGHYIFLRIEIPQDANQIRRTQRESDPSYFLGRGFGRCDPDYLALHIDEWAAGVAWIELGIGLNPRARTGIWELVDGTYNPFGYAEEHRLARISHREHLLPLSHRRCVGKH